MRDTEYTFYKRFRNRCAAIQIIRVENSIDSGFPDAVMCHGGIERMAEFKAEYAGDHVYVRNTQMSFNTKLLAVGVDVPIITGTLDGGFWLVPFSEFLTLPAQAYKLDYKRFCSRDFLGTSGTFVPKSSDWNNILIRLLFNRV